MAKIRSKLQKLGEYVREYGLAETAREVLRRADGLRPGTRLPMGTYLGKDELEAQRNEVWAEKLTFSVVVPLYNTDLGMLRETIESVRAQTYTDWELCLADGSDDAHSGVGALCRDMAETDSRIRYRKLEKNGGISENTNAALEMATGDYIALFDHDDLLMPNALYENRKAIRDWDADFLYSDEMVFRSPNRKKITAVRLKPDFSPESLLSNNYICHLTVFKKELTEKAGIFRKECDGSQDHDMILRLTHEAKRIVHIPKILYLWRASATSTAADINAKPYTAVAGRKAVRDFLKYQKGIDATVESTDFFPTMYRARYPLPEKITARVIILGSINDADHTKEVMEKAGWEAAVEVVIPGPGESRFRKLNEAAGKATEDVLIFLAGYPDKANAEWLRELLSHAVREEIGAVGARILFREGTVRHEGVVLGLGYNRLAGRQYYRQIASAKGYFGQAAVVSNVSAVALDCMAVTRRKFEEVGGFFGEYGNALGDVDLCLKLRARGYRNIYTPFAELTMGSKERSLRAELGKEWGSYVKDAAVFREKWNAELQCGDPYYHPDLSLNMPGYRISGKIDKALEKRVRKRRQI